eukprot:TRINITY_DN48813_c0_g1_i1.p1 TRINITY_DN48813_c0_g1~~TRINITY_DN48813_c0_g1_i1.p1  ORF type:complete len:434 (-),score=26.23 TRINITY_DN48813_c0_g1_i1:119-1420(-)
MATAMQPSIEALLAQLPRPSLESLIADKVRSGTIAYREVLAWLPQSMRRSKTGSAIPAQNNLPPRLPWLAIAGVVACLPLQQRLVCATVVCKSWRRLRDDPSLWATLTAAPLPKWLQDLGLSQLVKWLPAPHRVLRFDLDTKKNDCVPNLHRLLSMLTGLKSLCLAGYKITNGHVGHLARLPVAAELVDLTLDVYSSVSEATILRLLSNTSKLQCLGLSRRHMNLKLLQQVAGFVARRPSSALGLLELRCTQRADSLMGPGHGGLEWNTVRELGQLFPTLRKLDAGDFCGNCPPTGILVVPMQQLQNLTVRSIADCSDMNERADRSEMLLALLSSCPSLRSLSFCAGNRYYELEGQHTGRYTLSRQALAGLPPSLVDLHLVEVSLTPTLFVTCSLPLLQRLHVRRCGPYAEASVHELCHRCPCLKVQACVVEA